jgi:NADH-quinone oxidoreductase subunit L
MAFALGTGAWVAAIFHLMTHAFFKGLLFLGSGSVIHGMHGEQDMRNMGGLRKHMPITFWTFLIGSAANAGIFPLAGFWSKDEIIVGAWISHSPFGKIAAVLGLAAAFLTALYMFRLVFQVFFGKERFGHDVHPHESGPWMAVPLVILAVASIFVGFVGFPPEDGVFHHFLHEAFHHVEVHHVSMTMTWTFGIISTVVALSGVAVAYMVYMRKAVSTDALAEKYSGVYNFLLNKWYVDEFFMAAVVNPLKDIAMFLWRFVDVRIIDGIVNGVGLGMVGASQRMRRTQTGLVANYALQIAIGMVVLLGVFLLAFGNLF